MKETLEFKILKHLSENDNGEYFDVTHLENNDELLNGKLSSLLNLQYISEQTTPSFKNDYIEFINPKYKIEFEGLKYLESLKEKPISKDRKLYLTLFIIFGLIGSYGTFKTIFPDVSKSEFRTLKFEFNTLEKKYDSIVELNLEIKNKALDSVLISK